MDQKRDQRKRVVNFQREKPITEEQTGLRRDTDQLKKVEPVGRGVIATISIIVSGGFFAGLAENLGPTMGTGIFFWLLGTAIIALIAKWAKWY